MLTCLLRNRTRVVLKEILILFLRRCSVRIAVVSCAKYIFSINEVHTPFLTRSSHNKKRLQLLFQRVSTGGKAPIIQRSPSFCFWLHVVRGIFCRGVHPHLAELDALVVHLVHQRHNNPEDYLDAEKRHRIQCTPSSCGT